MRPITPFLVLVLASFLLRASLWAEQRNNLGVNVIPTPGAETITDASEHNKDVPVVTLFYATDRIPQKQDGKVVFPDGNTENAFLSYGQCEISLDLNYRREIHKETAWVRNKPDPVTCISSMPTEDFLPFVQKDPLDHTPSHPKAPQSTFIFIHGFNNSFTAAASTAAQIAYDLQLEGQPVLYSWPSQNCPCGYPGDKMTVLADGTIAHLKKFLLDYALNSKAQKMNLIAHSMGTYLLCEALLDIAQDPKVARAFADRINSIILVSADIGVKEFSDPGDGTCCPTDPSAGLGRDAYSRLQPFFGGKMVIYVSEKDLALDVSVKELVNHHERRVGQGGDTLVVRDGLTTIDATKVAQTQLGIDIGHDEFRHDGVIDDLYLYLNQGRPVAERLLSRREKDHKTYYEIFDGVHDDPQLDDLNWLALGASYQAEVFAGDYSNEFKLDAVIGGTLQLELGTLKGFFPSSLGLRVNPWTGPVRPFATGAYDFYVAGSGANTVLAQDLRWGLGVELVTNDGWGLALGEDWLFYKLSSTANLADQSSIQTMLGQVFPTGRFYFQLSKYFPVLM